MDMEGFNSYTCAIHYYDIEASEMMQPIVEELPREDFNGEGGRVTQFYHTQLTYEVMNGVLDDVERCAERGKILPLGEVTDWKRNYFNRPNKPVAVVKPLVTAECDDDYEEERGAVAGNVIAGLNVARNVEVNTDRDLDGVAARREAFFARPDILELCRFLGDDDMSTIVRLRYSDTNGEYDDLFFLRMEMTLRNWEEATISDRDIFGFLRDQAGEGPETADLPARVYVDRQEANRVLLLIDGEMQRGPLCNAVLDWLMIINDLSVEYRFMDISDVTYLNRQGRHFSDTDVNDALIQRVQRFVRNESDSVVVMMSVLAMLAPTSAVYALYGLIGTLQEADMIIRNGSMVDDACAALARRDIHAVETSFIFAMRMFPLYGVVPRHIRPTTLRPEPARLQVPVSISWVEEHEDLAAARLAHSWELYGVGNEEMVIDVDE